MRTFFIGTASIFAIAFSEFGAAACAAPHAPAAWDFAGASIGSADFSGADDADFDGRETRISGPVAATPSIDVGFSWRYRSIDIGGVDPAPQANGDLHTAAMPVMWRDSQHKIVVAPALSVSSNALKNPDAIDADSFQLALGWERRGELHDGWQWALGLCADHRFGSYRVYPLAGALWQGGAWQLRLGWPDTQAQWHISEHWSLQFALTPDGGQWQVFDDDLERESDFVWETWRAEVALEWEPARNFALRLFAGSLAGQRLSFRLNDRSRFDKAADSSPFIGLSINWRLASHRS